MRHALWLLGLVACSSPTPVTLSVTVTPVPCDNPPPAAPEVIRLAGFEIPAALCHEQARRVLRGVLVEELGRPPTLAELQGLQALASQESDYGAGWRDDGIDSRNWGAIHARDCGPGTFVAVDYGPGRGAYETCLVKYGTHSAGARGFVRAIRRRPVAWDGLERADLRWFVQGLYGSGYFEGSGITDDERIDRKEDQLRRRVKLIARELRERVAVK